MRGVQGGMHIHTCAQMSTNTHAAVSQTCSMLRLLDATVHSWKVSVPSGMSVLIEAEFGVTQMK